MRSFHAISENIPAELQNVTDMTDIKKDLTFCNFVDIPGSQMFESQNFVLCPLSLFYQVFFQRTVVKAFPQMFKSQSFVLFISRCSC